MLTVKTAVEDPEAPEERVILLLERAREAKSPSTRGPHLAKALMLLSSLPNVKPPASTGLMLLQHSLPPGSCFASSVHHKYVYSEWRLHG